MYIFKTDIYEITLTQTQIRSSHFPINDAENNN